MSNRKSVLVAIQQLGTPTCGDIDDLAGLGMTKTRFTIGDLKKAGMIATLKDDVTGQPAYKLTPAGAKWLQDNASDSDETQEVANSLAKTTPAKAPAAKDKDVCCGAAKVMAKTASQELAELRASIDELIAGSAAKTKRIEHLEAEKQYAEARVTEYAETVAKLQGELGHARIQIDALNEQLMLDDGAVDVKDAAAAYLLRVPKRKPRILTQADSAVKAATLAAKIAGRAEVLALVPLGVAVAKKVKAVEFKEASAV